jgi:hypothetical protein
MDIEVSLGKSVCRDGFTGVGVSFYIPYPEKNFIIGL